MARSPEEAEQLVSGGYLQCYGKKYNGEPCQFHIAPDAQQRVVSQSTGYYTCPVCKKSHDILEETPWHGEAPEAAERNRRSFEHERYENDFDRKGFIPGGTTRIGIPLQQQAQIGEDVVEGLGSLPGYGPILSWHHGGAIAQSPFDGTVKDWGIEVKTIGYDTENHRFVVGKDERYSKNAEAKEMGLKGVLGVLVMLNYRSSLADVYVREMPLTPWTSSRGVKMPGGIFNFRTDQGYHLVREVSFPNPFMNPHRNAPQVAQPTDDDLPF